MTYEEFLNIPVSAIKDLETIFCLKLKWELDFTPEEVELFKHILTYYKEQVKSAEFSNKIQNLKNSLNYERNTQ